MGASETWIRLAQLVQGARQRRHQCQCQKPHLSLTEATIACRARGFVSNVLSATTIGTHERPYDFPFVFEDGAIRKKYKEMVMSEHFQNECRAVYFARQKGRSGSSHRHIQEAVYRESYSGRVAATYTNKERLFSASKFTFKGCLSEDILLSQMGSEG